MRGVNKQSNAKGHYRHRHLKLRHLNILFRPNSFSKIFRTKSKDVVDECMLLFGCSSVLTLVNKRKAKFLDD